MKDLQIWADGAKKADWDVGMAVDAIRMSSFLDVIILVTGDGDFLPLVDYLKWGQGGSSRWPRSGGARRRNCRKRRTGS